MSVSRCLGEAMAAIGNQPRGQWGAYLETLPEVCPHDDCTSGQGCRGYVAEYFRMQWRIRVEHERLAKIKAMRAGMVTA